MSSGTHPLSKPLKGFFLLLIALVVGVNFVHHLGWQARALRTGTLPPEPLKPFYGYAPQELPATTPPGGKGALGMDFSQVYFAAQAMDRGLSPYFPADPAFADPLNRLSAYPPLTNWLAIPLSRLPYWDALIVHELGSFLLLSLLTALVLLRAGAARSLGLVLLLFVLLTLYTPIGLTHLERGQFELFPACASLLFFAGLFLPRPRPALLPASGLFSALKITSLPLVGSLCFLGLCANGIRKGWPYLLPLGAFSLAAAAFWPLSLEYLRVVGMYQAQAPEGGFALTLVYFMPSSLSRFLQIGCMLGVAGLFWLRSRGEDRPRLWEEFSLPFALAMAALGMCVGNYNYEYRVVSVLGLIPALVLWDSRSPAAPRVKLAAALSFALFLAIAFRTLPGSLAIGPRAMTAVYLLFSAGWLALSAWIILARPAR